MSMSTGAPGRLEVVRAFVNTRNVEAATDAIATAAGLARWLKEQDLPMPDRLGASDIERVLDLREALREVLAANHDRAPISDATLQVLNKTASGAGLAVAFTRDRTWVVTSKAVGVNGLLGALLAIVVDSMADGHWPRLKVCVNDACRWAFYDHSRARSAKWCSMEVCGNRMKQQAWRERRATAAAPGR